LVAVRSICDSEVFLLYHDGMQLLTRLVFERGSADAAGKVAEIMGADLVHQVFSSLLN
jgi:zinc finger FYVE domain-containing protein 26